MKYEKKYFFGDFLSDKLDNSGAHKLNETAAMYNYRVRQIPLFWEKSFKKKLMNIFSNFFFYFRVQSFRLKMENNFIQMAASAIHAVDYKIGSIFKHIIDCVQLYFTNGFTNIAL